MEEKEEEVEVAVMTDLLSHGVIAGLGHSQRAANPLEDA